MSNASAEETKTARAEPRHRRARRGRRALLAVPLVLGLSGAATVVTAGTASAMPNYALCDRVATLVVTARTETAAQYWLDVGQKGGCW